MYFLFQTIFLFILFNIVIILFGFSIFTMFYKKIFTKESSFIKKYILSYSLGLTLYIILSYFFMIIWNYNAFTGFYFYVIFDFLGLINLIKNQNPSLSLKEKILRLSNNLKEKISFLIKKRNPLIFLILILFYIIGFYIIKYGSLISSSTSQFWLDPYTWEDELYYLIRYHSLNYTHNLYDYPFGILFFPGGMLKSIVFVNIEQVHFVVKIFPSLILIENMFLMALLGYEMFPKKKAIIFLLATSMFFYPYFLTRSSLFVPKILITQLEIILFFLVLYKDLPLKFREFLFGMILGTMLLIHPLYGLINTVFFLIFAIFYELIYSKSNNSHNTVFKNYYIKLESRLKII